MPPRRVAFFIGDHIGKDEETDGFARGNLLPTLSEGSLLRVSEFPAKRFDLGWLRVTSKSLNRTLFGLGILLFGTRTGMVKNPSVRASKLDLRCFAEVLRSGKHRCLYGVQNSIIFALFCINAPPMYANTCEIVDYEGWVKEKYCGVEKCVIMVQ